MVSRFNPGDRVRYERSVGGFSTFTVIKGTAYDLELLSDRNGKSYPLMGMLQILEYAPGLLDDGVTYRHSCGCTWREHGPLVLCQSACSGGNIGCSDAHDAAGAFFAAQPEAEAPPFRVGERLVYNERSCTGDGKPAGVVQRIGRCGNDWKVYWVPGSSSFDFASVLRRVAAPPSADAPLRVGDRVHVIRACSDDEIDAPGTIVRIDGGTIPYLVKTTFNGRTIQVWCDHKGLRRVTTPAAETEAPLRVGELVRVIHPEHTGLTGTVFDVPGERSQYFRAAGDTRVYIRGEGLEWVFESEYLRRVDPPAAEPQQSEPHGWVEVGAWVRCRDCGHVGEVRTLYSTTASIWDHDTGSRHCSIAALDVVPRSQRSESEWRAEPVALPAARVQLLRPVPEAPRDRSNPKAEREKPCSCGGLRSDPYHFSRHEEWHANVWGQKSYRGDLDQRIATARETWAKRMKLRYGRNAPQGIDPDEGGL